MIERRFLGDFRIAYEADCSPDIRISMGYLAIEPQGYDVMIMQHDQSCRMIFESHDNPDMNKTGITLTHGQFDALLAGVSPDRFLEKTQFTMPYGTKKTEVATFNLFETTRLQPLVITEFEFSSARAAAKLPNFGWLLEEVTGLEEYTDRSLALNGLPEQFKSYGEEWPLDWPPSDPSS